MGIWQGAAGIDLLEVGLANTWLFVHMQPAPALLSVSLYSLPFPALPAGLPQTYQLSVDSGQGYNLDLSLFERLVRQRSFPVHSLAEQHRMRPAISALIRDTIYPQLRVRCCAMLHLLRGLPPHTSKQAKPPA